MIWINIQQALTPNMIFEAVVYFKSNSLRVSRKGIIETLRNHLKVNGDYFRHDIVFDNELIPKTCFVKCTYEDNDYSDIKAMKLCLKLFSDIDFSSITIEES